MEKSFTVKMRNWKQTRRDRICVSISSSPQQGQKACCLFPVPWLHSMQRSEGQAWTRQRNSGWELGKGPRQGEQGLQPRKEGASASTSYHRLHALKLEKSLLWEIPKHNLSHSPAPMYAQVQSTLPTLWFPSLQSSMRCSGLGVFIALLLCTYCARSLLQSRRGWYFQ